MLSKKHLKTSKTLSFKLMIMYALLYILSSLIAFLVFYFFISAYFYSKINKDMKSDIKELQITYEDDGLKVLKEEIEEEAEAEGTQNVYFRLFDINGELLFSSDLEEWENLTLNTEAVKAVNNGEKYIINFNQMHNKQYEIVTVYGHIDDNLILEIGEVLEEHTVFMNLLRNVFFLLCAFSVVFSAFIGLIIARRALKGVEMITKTALLISEGGALNKRVNIKTNDLEIKQLANTFNKMLDHIEVLVTEIKEITDNIAHDLKSPLTRIRGNAEITITSEKSNITDYKKMASNTIEECDSLLEIINTMLYITKADMCNSYINAEKMDLCDVIYDACDLFTPVLEDKQLRLEINIPDKCDIYGENQAIQRMVANLIDNAIKYTPDKGKIIINIEINDKDVNLVIKDTGIGIPQKDIPYIFKRFYRSNEESKISGIGLGLSLVNAIVKKHTGNIAVESKINSGSTFTVSLPKTYNSVT